MPLTNKYHIFSTTEWGAVFVPPPHSFTVSKDTVLHHMDTSNGPALSGAPALRHAFQLARDCQGWHMNSNGWRDTGQHFTVTRSGIVLEGRNGSLRSLLQGKCIRGAHAFDQDTGADDNDSFGTELEGNYSSSEMPKAQWDAAVWLQAYICFMSHIDTQKIIGHRDTGCSTACPGDWLHSHLSLFRSEAHDLKLRMIEEAKHN